MRAAALATALALGLASAARAENGSGDPLDAAVRAPRLALGSVVLVGEDHPAPDLADFPVTLEGEAPGLSARWVEGPVRWLRAPDGLPVPRGRLRVSVAVEPERAVLLWRGRAAALQRDGAGASSAELFVPLLEGGAAVLELDGKPAAKIRVGARPRAGAAHAIDHTCSPWNLKVSGLDDAYLAASCRMIAVGRVGSEEPSLEVRWAAAGVTLPGGASPPMTAQLLDGRPARATVFGPDGAKRVVELTASVAPRLRRMRLAWGAGPYGLSSSGPSGNGAAGAAMLYGNFRLRYEDSLSVRAFEAAVGRDPAHAAFFNNLGLYFAYDAARVVDQRFRLTVLLGAQAVTFAPRGLARSSYGELIAPQGFEVSYVDAFGLRNKTLSGGLFLQPGTSKHYQNLWVRFGDGLFGELNYLSWRAGDRYAKMWGLSVGAPLAQFF